VAAADAGGAAVPGSSLVEWSVAIRALGSESGDQYLVSRTADGVLVTVVDGLGHGPEAAAVAKAALAALETDPTRDLPARLAHCHACLRDTRGAVLSLAAFAPGRLTWLGVGNVDGVLVRAGSRAVEQLLVRSGVVGRRLPSLEVTRLTVARGDTLIVATDGVDGLFTEDVAAFRAQPTAEHLLVAHGKGTDDALVMIVRYLGPNE
jgi:negative regulator of sigma-B (phosphoserine phosphatase)